MVEKNSFWRSYYVFSGYNLYYNAFNTPKGVNFDQNVVGTELEMVEDLIS
jgi:hypothetical protein